MAGKVSIHIRGGEMLRKQLQTLKAYYGEPYSVIMVRLVDRECRRITKPEPLPGCAGCSVAAICPVMSDIPGYQPCADRYIPLVDGKGDPCQTK